jgi:hypothetical protein
MLATGRVGGRLDDYAKLGDRFPTSYDGGSHPLWWTPISEEEPEPKMY